MKLCAKPRFLIYKGGVCQKEVDGVLINDIENEVNRLLPAMDDWDPLNHWFINWEYLLQDHYIHKTDRQLKKIER